MFITHLIPHIYYSEFHLLLAHNSWFSDIQGVQKELEFPYVINHAKTIILHVVTAPATFLPIHTNTVLLFLSP